jgi:hypothetical protein
MNQKCKESIDIMINSIIITLFFNIYFNIKTSFFVCLLAYQNWWNRLRLMNKKEGIPLDKVNFIKNSNFSKYKLKSLLNLVSSLCLEKNKLF